jgi:hypothetical protein
MSIVVESKRKSLETITQVYPNACILDVTSRGSQPWVKFSPFYPHGTIPVPLSPGFTAASVEGIWQGLKVFAHADIDVTAFTNTRMTGLKRTARTYGSVQGHRAGVHGTILLSYVDARYEIYLPAYRWVLDHCLQAELEHIQDMHQSQTVILLDYETNGNIKNLTKPLSHAALIVKYLTNQWPEPY